MKIKRYIGNTTQEAMYKLRRELGPDTVILHTRKIKKPGIFGFFKKPLIEVVAALEENENEKANIKNNNYRTQENSNVNLPLFFLLYLTVKLVPILRGIIVFLFNGPLIIKSV